MVKTTFNWPEDEGDDMQPMPGETPEEFFTRIGKMRNPGMADADATVPQPQMPQQAPQPQQPQQPPQQDEQHRKEVAEFMAVQDQMIMEAAGFGKELVAYFRQLIAGGIPFEAVIVLTREWQQAEINRRTNLDALNMRLDHE